MSRDERAEQATHNVYVSMDRRERGLLSCEPPVCVWMCACDAAYGAREWLRECVIYTRV